MDDRVRDRDGGALEIDVLERACNRIWVEIGELLPHHRRLCALGDRRTAEESRALERIVKRLASLRRRAERYRGVMRDEAWAKWLADRERG
jgi:hypothetical protein